MLHIFLSNRPGDVALRHDRAARSPATTSSCAATTATPVADGEEGSLWVRGPTRVHRLLERPRALARDVPRPVDAHGRSLRARCRTATTPTAAAPTTCSRSAASGCRRSRSSRALAAHEAVLEAAVVGHEDADGLTKPKAFVVLKPGRRARAPAELQAFVKTRLAPYKYPRWIEFVSRAAEDRDRQDPAVQAARDGRSSDDRGDWIGEPRAAARSCSCTRASARSRSGATRPTRSRAATGLPGVRLLAPGLRPLVAGRPAAAADVHARRGRARCPRSSPPPRHHRSDPRRPQRRRIDRDHRRRRRPVASARARADRAARVRRGHLGRIDRGGRATPTSTATCARGSRSTTPTSTARSGAGTARGSIPRSARGTSRRTCRASPRPMLVVQGTADQYGTLAQVEAIERQLGGPVETMLVAGAGHSPFRDAARARTREDRRVRAPRLLAPAPHPGCGT